MTFLTILGVTEILCSFRLVLERKIGKEIPESSRLEFSEKVLANNFALSEAEDHTSRLVNRELLGIPQNSLEPSFWEEMDSFCFISICKFGSFKNPFATITNLSEFYFRFTIFNLLVQTKKVISMNYVTSTSSWKPWQWVRLDLTFTMRDIYIKSKLNPLTNFTSYRVSRL